MTTRLNRRTQSPSKEELQKQVQMLTLKNQQLSKELKAAQHASRSVNEMLESARIRSEQHRRNKNKLEKAGLLVQIAKAITWILSDVLFCHAVALGYIEYSASNGISKDKIFWCIIWCSDTRIGGVITGLLGFVVSVTGQIIFPAPWRSFTGATGFALKQMLNIFLPSWCVGFLSLFAHFALLSLDWDRQAQVSITKTELPSHQNETTKNLQHPLM